MLIDFEAVVRCRTAFEPAVLHMGVIDEDLVRLAAWARRAWPRFVAVLMERQIVDGGVVSIRPSVRVRCAGSSDAAVVLLGTAEMVDGAAPWEIAPLVEPLFDRHAESVRGAICLLAAERGPVNPTAVRLVRDDLRTVLLSFRPLDARGSPIGPRLVSAIEVPENGDWEPAVVETLRVAADSITCGRQWRREADQPWEVLVEGASLETRLHAGNRENPLTLTRLGVWPPVELALGWRRDDRTKARRIASMLAQVWELSQRGAP